MLLFLHKRHIGRLLEKALTVLFFLAILSSCNKAIYESATSQVNLQKYDGINRVLIIGIDGCRPDLLTKEIAPNIVELMDQPETAYSLKAKNESRTMSGTNWSSMLTGVHHQKHHVNGNGFRKPNFDEHPSIFAKAESTYENLNTASIVHWKPINKQIIQDAVDISLFGNDEEVKNLAVDLLQTNDTIHFVFLHFDDVDHAGHSTGFGVENPNYVNAIKQTDEYIGAVLIALASRDLSHENWLTILSTDHGGKGKSHSKGRLVPEIRTVFAIFSGNAVVQQGVISEQVNTVDIAATVLQHLGVQQKGLDGKVVGIKPVN